ncbi:MAG: potassium-transporting ATPase subunit KdpB [Thermoplasmata archaeon]|nr:potassium-transporting ATPase subunit KdpB [Thermoplasmata archaeon]MCI4341406.1 potassium-transporting ATPase subunit KdpB [Thermoplasmata archaeon]
MAAARATAPESSRRRPHTSTTRVLAESLRMFSPRREYKHPVMFTVYVLFLFLLVVTLYPAPFPDIQATYHPAYYEALTVILFLTLWFSHLAEAIAEAQGRAQADALRQVRSGMRARQLAADGSTRWVGTDLLRVGDRVEVRAGEAIPLDGDVVEGAAQIDESMMTGESELVTRESGGDKTSVLGGTRVVQGTIRIRITAVQGQSFLDRLIRLVEGAVREKSPNELALDTVLAGFTIALLVVVVAFLYLVTVFPYVHLSVGTVIALFVSLMPTTIGALLPAIGISGVNRVAKTNVIAKSGRAVETAGDLDVIILDKTGTITVGNRLAVQFVPAPEVAEAELTARAMLASSLDDTPEGRSILRLAGRRGAASQRLEEGAYRVVPFSAERKMSGIVLRDGTEVYKGSVKAIEAYAGPLPAPLRQAAEEASRKGMTPLALAANQRVLGLVLLKDVVKPGIRDRLRELRTMGIRTVMCTGDNRLTAQAIGRESGVDEVIAEAKPETKLEVIEREKAQGRLVAMTGDGTNDAPALARADVGLAMNSGTSAAKEAGNMVDLDNDPTKLIEIVSIGKQLLVTRGALTTFSITNDVAKYFAIIPGLFIAANGGVIAGVALLNVLGLGSPELAVLATVFFNAIIIPLLIPLALYGVRFRPKSAIDLLRQNLVLYGVGGLLSAFVGIWLLYQALLWLGQQPLWQTLVHLASEGLPLLVPHFSGAFW